MSILYDESQNAIATESRRVLDARSDTERLLTYLEHTGGYDPVFWDTVVEQGWTAIGIPEEHGGLGLGLVELGLVAQACGAATSGAPFLISGYAAAHALLNCSNSDAKTAHLPAIASGEMIATWAFAEENGPLPQEASVRYADGKLNGSKPGVVAGLKADMAVVLASQNGVPVLVLAPLADVTRTPVESFDNSRLYADLSFVDTPAELLASGDAAVNLARDVLAHVAVILGYEQVGGAEALLFTARDYALTRKAFGQSIGSFQSVKHRIAEMYGLIEIARANCIAAAAKAGDPGFVTAAAATRIAASEAYDTAARDTVQIHGGIGVTWEAGLHLHMRRARSLAIEAGNLLYWEDVLAEQLTGVAA